MSHGLKLAPQLGHASFVSSIALSADGTTMISGSWDDTIKVWDAFTGRLCRTLQAHAGLNNSVAVSNDSKTVVGADGRVVKLRDATTGSTIIVLKGHDKPVVSVALSADGRTVVSGSEDNTIKIWDATSGQLVRTLLGHSGCVGSVALSEDGLYVVSGSGDTTVKVWERNSGRLLRTLEGHTSSIRSVALSTNSRVIVSGGYDKAIKIWDLHTGQLIRTIDAGLNGPVVLSADGRTILWSRVGSRYPSYPIQVFDILKGELLRSFEGHHEAKSLALSADGRILVSGSTDCTINIWDVETGLPLQTIAGFDQRSNAVTLSHDKRTVVSGGTDATVRVWDTTTGRLRHILTSHDAAVYAVALSADGRTVISGSRGFWERSIEDFVTPKVKLWDTLTGTPLMTLEGSEDDTFHAVAMTPDGRYVIGGNDGRSERLKSDEPKVSRPAIQVWDRESGKLLHTLTGHEHTVRSISSMPDSRTIISGDGSQAIRWDIVAGQRLAPDPADDALLAAAKTPADLLCAGPAICLLADDRRVRARFITLPGSHWISIAEDEKTYTASDGAEAFLLLVEDGTNTLSKLDAGFVAAHRRNDLDIGL